jgi:uncharacterized membrane protein
MNIQKLTSKAIQVVGSRAFLLLFASLLAISFSVVYVASEPRPQERFLSISTLDSNMKSDNYYPRSDSTLNAHDHVNWYLGVYNKMGTAEYLSVRVKLLNSTQAIPDDTLNLPSPENHIIELKHVLMNNSTWVIPLKWFITETDREQGYVVIKGLNINGIAVDDLNVKSLDGEDFRMLIELWRYDADSDSFVFAWTSGIDKRSAWNQIWFNTK